MATICLSERQQGHWHRTWVDTLTAFFRCPSEGQQGLLEEPVVAAAQITKQIPGQLIGLGDWHGHLAAAHQILQDVPQILDGGWNHWNDPAPGVLTGGALELHC